MQVARILAIGIAIMAVLGIGQRLGLPLGLFDFDGEGKPPALWSALVLATGGALGVLVAAEDRGYWLRWLAIGGLLAFMALDEGAALHEHIEASDLNISWQAAYAPIIAAGGVAWLFCLARMWPYSLARNLWIGGAVLWFISQVDEQIQSNPTDGRVRGYGALSSVEEIFEVTGSALFLLALLLVLHRLAQKRELAD
jgi:hypothetical protein